MSYDPAHRTMTMGPCHDAPFGDKEVAFSRMTPPERDAYFLALQLAGESAAAVNRAENTLLYRATIQKPNAK